MPIFIMGELAEHFDILWDQLATDQVEIDRTGPFKFRIVRQPSYSL